MSSELAPLSWEEFDKMHREAWKNGWTYGPAFTELYLEYLENWNYFYNYLDNLAWQFTHYKELKILIGEAPPFWAGNSEKKNRTYFYNPNHINPDQTWLTIPYNFFVQGKSGFSKIKSADDKTRRLEELASKAVLLIDVFPFPVWQDTDVRNSVSDAFSTHIKNYFVPHIEHLIDYIKSKASVNDIKIKYGLMAPEFTSLQIMYGKNSSKYFWDNLKPSPIDIESKTVFRISQTEFTSIGGIGNLPVGSKKAKFLHRIIMDNYWIKGKNIVVCENHMELLPILINGRTPTFTNFFNSSEDILKEKFGIKP